MATETKTFTLADVEHHSKTDDIWVVIRNKVYDVTKYLEDHPGGVAVLQEIAGTDATVAFDDVGHSAEATDELKLLYIGDLAEEEHIEVLEIFRPTFHQVEQIAAVIVPDKKSKKTSRHLVRGVSILSLGLALSIGGAVWTGRTAELIAALRRPLSLASSYIPSSIRSDASRRPGLFWWGFGIATVADIALSISLGTWVLSKFDVQEEFTHFAPRRTATAAGYMPILKVPTSFTRPKVPKPAQATRVIDPQEWRLFKLVRKTLISPNVYRIVFALPHAHSVLGLPTGQHIALRAMINGKNVARSYTPVSNNTDLGRIELVIKVYEQGLMTKHLEAMRVGESIEIRGPKGAMQYLPNQYAKHIGMIAGGTGITPMFQLIRAICDDEEDNTTINLLYANNTEEDILLRSELDGYVEQCPGNFQVHYVLAKPGPNWTGSSGFISADLIKERLPLVADETKVLLCGPPPMVNAMSKTLVAQGFKAPGAMSKATDQVFLF
ncbi:hypothetical protein B0H63DRAFT_527559 [Podospora didyma]|uniref:NADH-cytochrome b5 reductase 1 n=1 Tax=Podospora didyma TaxID=330526 RepID=A0AAE0N6P7_9PEZI|nr:hypothetical protein B0H63DRAFT_527559 [Podospora didyma]